MKKPTEDDFGLVSTTDYNPTTPVTEPTVDELRLRIEEMYRSCLQDGSAIVMNRKSADGSPWKIRVTDFTDITMQLIADQVAKAKIEAFDVAFDCHDYDRLRAYRAELVATLNGVKK